MAVLLATTEQSVTSFHTSLAHTFWDIAHKLVLLSASSQCICLYLRSSSHVLFSTWLCSYCRNFISFDFLQAATAKYTKTSTTINPLLSFGLLCGCCRAEFVSDFRTQSYATILFTTSYAVYCQHFQELFALPCGNKMIISPKQRITLMLLSGGSPYIWIAGELPIFVLSGNLNMVVELDKRTCFLWLRCVIMLCRW